MEKQEDFMWNILKNINGWLEFAERKNIQLASFLGIGVFGAVLLRIGIPCLENFYNLLSFKIFIILATISWLFAIWSFYPITIPSYSSKSKSINHPNYLFYGTLAYLDEKEIEKIYIENYGLNTIKENLLKDFIRQIKANSEICIKKYWCFKWGSISLISSLFFFVLTLVIFYVK